MPPVTKQLRSNVLKKALKAYIVPAFCNKYEVCSFRVFWEDLDSIWIKRHQLESLLERDNRIVAFFSCITVTEKKSSKGKAVQYENSDTSSDEDSQEENLLAGLSFWIVFDCPDITMAAFENTIIKVLLESSFHIKSCNVIRSRSRFFLFFFFLVLFILN